MIVRLVRMAFRPGEGERFLELFEGWRHRIRAFPGCHHLALWRDTSDPDVFFTHSIWAGEDDLARYRDSEVFASVWPVVKALFREPAAAWSVHEEVRMP